MFLERFCMRRYQYVYFEFLGIKVYFHMDGHELQYFS